MAIRTFSYWWGGQNPSKLGVCASAAIADARGIAIESYFRDWLFAGVLTTYADAQPRHGILPWFSDESFYYQDGWDNINWKTAMYLPTLYEAKTGNPAFTPFKNKILASYIGSSGPNGQGISSKTVLIGCRPNMLISEGGSQTTAQQMFNAVGSLRTALYDAKPSNPPQMTWIGPNIFYQVNGFTGGDAWRNGPTWMASWDALMQADPNRAPSVYGFAIQAWDAADYALFFGDIAAYMAAAHPGKPWRITFANCPASDIGTQKAVMSKALDVMDATPTCKGTHWWLAANDFGQFYSPHTLVAPTGYPPKGKFPWPYAGTELGAHWNFQWNHRYAMPNPANAPAQGVQPYPIDNPG